MRLSALPLLAAVVLAAACGREAPRVQADSAGSPPPRETGGSPPPPPPTAEADSGTTPENPFAFNEADLDVYERGLRKEIELVHAARAREAAASTPEERAAAAQAGWETTTAPEAARAIGADPDRYAKTRSTVERVLETLDFQGKIPGPKEMNMDLASPEMKARLAGDPFAGLDPASAAALRSRLDRIAPVWIEFTELTAVGG